MGRLLSCVAAAGLLLGAAGCSLTPDPRKNLLESTSSHAVYRLPPESLLNTTRELLTEQGYELLPTADPMYVHTTWKIDGNLEVGAAWSRILVNAHRLSDGRTLVRAYRMSYTTNGRAASHPSLSGGSKDNKNSESGMGGRYVAGEPMSPTKPTLQRAADFEWALLARVEPRFAAHLKQRVDAYLTEPQSGAASEVESVPEPLAVPQDLPQGPAR
jgi:hypothetical protein